MTANNRFRLSAQDGMVVILARVRWIMTTKLDPGSARALAAELFNCANQAERAGRSSR